MLFITAQPYKVMEFFINNDEYFAPEFDKNFTNGEGVSNKPIENLFGYTPIFVSSIDNITDRLVTQTVASPSCAECLIIFETNRYDIISFCKWLQYIYDRDMNADIKYKQGTEPEYIVKSIKKSEIRVIIPFEHKHRTLAEQITFYKSYILDDHFADQVFPNDSKQYIERYIEHNIKKYSSLQRRFYKTFKPNLYNEEAFLQLRKDINNLFR